MTEHDKLALLNMINSVSEALQYIVAAEKYDDNFIDYSKLKSCYREIIHDSIKEAESKGCEVIWEGRKAVKIVEK